ncbi:MAG: 50S ribosomal protein L13 [Chitinispirillales bacterium]|jgi:large subunit ribosomal protein L13|nr:50S ribosomal protein L13 [Chitinispirillales bacterium]
MKTVVVDTASIERKWFVVDASELTLGRLASKAAQILIGKGKVAYSPNQDHGDYLIVVNADKVRLSGTKPETKGYFRHSMYQGGDKIRSFEEQMKLDSAKVVTHAVHGMVSKNPRGRAIMRKLFVYRGPEHPHAAQQPKELKLAVGRTPVL